MAHRAPGFRICDQKGFHVTFENGWTVSVQFGRGNYSGNYDHTGAYADPVPASPTAEVAAWPNGGEMIALGDGDTVLGWQTPEQVLALMNDIAARPIPGEQV
ncbi:hypothetical protein [Brevundimonas sp. LjRoot202]|uniref:hypothetical protein n=1 Tax=Brevundimonas sp. LjRoot202 TaxID=3342281 RepID=UPI003ED0C966